MISRMELKPAKMDLIYSFFETYLKLSKEEEKKMSEEVKKLPKEEAERIIEWPNSYLERGIEIGIEKGKEIAISKEREKVIRNMLKKGLSIDLIADVLGVREEEVRKMKENI